MPKRDWTRYEQVLKLRRQGLSLSKIGKMIGRHRERVRQMEAATIRTLDGRWHSKSPHYTPMPPKMRARLLPLTDRELEIIEHYGRYWSEGAL